VAVEKGDVGWAEVWGSLQSILGQRSGREGEEGEAANLSS
jgi:hypothetical protein